MLIVGELAGEALCLWQLVASCWHFNGTSTVLPWNFIGTKTKKIYIYIIASIRISQKIQCLPYARFFNSQSVIKIGLSSPWKLV